MIQVLSKEHVATFVHLMSKYVFPLEVHMGVDREGDYFTVVDADGQLLFKGENRTVGHFVSNYIKDLNALSVRCIQLGQIDLDKTSATYYNGTITNVNTEPVQVPFIDLSKAHISTGFDGVLFYDGNIRRPMLKIVGNEALGDLAEAVLKHVDLLNKLETKGNKNAD